MQPTSRPGTGCIFVVVGVVAAIILLFVGGGDVVQGAHFEATTTTTTASSRRRHSMPPPDQGKRRMIAEMHCPLFRSLFVPWLLAKLTQAANVFCGGSAPQ